MSETEPTRVDDELNIQTPPQKLNAEWVSRDSIEPNEWNPNEMSAEEHEKLKQAIINQGWTQPIVVHTEEDYIIDGEQRWTVAAQSEIQEAEYLTPDDVPPGHVPIFRITVSEEQAKIATIQHNRARGFVSYDSLYEYFKEFDEQGTLDELRKEIGWSAEDVERIVEQQTVAEAVGGQEDIGEAWEPVDVRELDEEDIDYSTTSSALRRSAMQHGGDAEDYEEADRINVVLSPTERSFVEAVLTRDQTADKLVKYLSFMDDEDLIEVFQRRADIEPSEEFPHPDDIDEE